MKPDSIRKRNIMSYSSISENDVLTVKSTEFNVLVLLNTGTVLSWGRNNAALGRQCVDANVDCFIPYPIKLPVPIVEIACGISHCLARGINFKVYSWGYNSYGQVIIDLILVGIKRM
jgi:alpha-tubulin suppressor-like RCC1 family protein